MNTTRAVIRKVGRSATEVGYKASGILRLEVSRAEMYAWPERCVDVVKPTKIRNAQRIISISQLHALQH